MRQKHIVSKWPASELVERREEEQCPLGLAGRRMAYSGLAHDYTAPVRSRSHFDSPISSLRSGRFGMLARLSREIIESE